MEKKMSFDKMKMGTGWEKDEFEPDVVQYYIDWFINCMKID